MFKETIERLLEQHCSPQLIRQIEDDGRDASLWAAFQEGGFLELLATEEAGGAGMSMRDVYPILMMMGEAAMPLPLAQTILLRRLLPLEGVSATARIAISQHLVDLDADGIICKRVPQGKYADYIVAESNQGSLILLDTSTATAEYSGIRACSFVTLSWTSVGNIIEFPCEAGQLKLLHAALTAALLCGAMRRVLRMCVQFASERSQFGRPIGKFQAIQHQLSVMAEHVAAASVATELAFYSADDGFIFDSVAVAKSRSSEAANLISVTAHALHGAMGITEEFDLQLYTRRLHDWRLSTGAEDVWNTEIGRRFLAQRELTLGDFAMQLSA